MTAVLNRYHPRSPRYILLPQDQCLIRVAGPKQTPWEEGTEIYNISKTGLCFTAPEILLPNMNESIRIQFDVPGSEQMACYAIVVRIEKVSQEVSMVAVEFAELTPAQQWNISRGLSKKKNFNEDAIVVESVNMKGRPKIISYLFFVSVGFSLFFSAFLLFLIFRFLSDPQWIDKSYLILKVLLSNITN